MKRERPGSRDAAKRPSAGVQPPRKPAAAASSSKQPPLPRKAAARKAAPAKKAAPAPKTAPAAKAAPARKVVPAAAKKTTAARKPAPAKKPAAPPPRPVAKARAVKATPRPAGAKAARTPKAQVGALVVVTPDLTEEERIGSSKFADTPPRVFEDERFIFPETYGQNRVRLLVKDPHWLFAHWDVDQSVFAALRSELGERAAALSRLTLRVTDPDHGGGMVIHLPENARSWYLRADRVRRLYRAELGLTLPSGEYRSLALSNVASAPVAGAAAQPASGRGMYAVPRRDAQGFVAIGGWVEGDQDGLEDLLTPAGDGGRVAAAAVGPGPWHPAPGDARQPHFDEGPRGHGDEGAPGGASDVHRR